MMSRVIEAKTTLVQVLNEIMTDLRRNFDFIRFVLVEDGNRNTVKF